MESSQRSTSVDSKTPSSFWARIGQIGTIVGVALGLVGIYNALVKNGPQLQGHCVTTSAPTQLPVFDYEEALKPIMRKHLGLEGFKEHVAAAKLTPKKLSDLDVILLRNEITGAIGSDLDALSRERTIRRDVTSQGMTVCTIENTGTEPAKEVTIDLSHAPTSISVDGKAYKPDSASPTTVRIDSVRPGPNLDLRIWHSDYLRPKMFISFQGGRGSLHEGKIFYGWKANFLFLISEAGFPIFLILIAAILVLSLLNKLESASKLEPKTKDAPSGSGGSSPAPAREPALNSQGE